MRLVQKRLAFFPANLSNASDPLTPRTVERSKADTDDRGVHPEKQLDIRSVDRHQPGQFAHVVEQDAAGLGQAVAVGVRVAVVGVDAHAGGNAG